MTIEQTPNITSIETDHDPMVNGEGAVIPLIIGQTGNTVEADNIQIKRYRNIEQVGSSIENGGIGNAETNMTYQFCKKFLKETKKVYSDDIGLPFIYVIDMGSIDFTNGDAWAEAFNVAMTQQDVGEINIVGFKKEDKTKSITDDEIATIVGIMSSLNEIMVNDSKKGRPKNALFTVEYSTDEDMMKITDDSKTTFIQKSRIWPCVSDFYPEMCARFCLTPYDGEPGFYDFRSVSAEDVIIRTDNQEELLQNAGINFIRVEMEGNIEHAKLCLGVSSAMARAERPADALPHFRRNTDHLLRRIHFAGYPQLKRNELKVNFKMLQSDVDDIVDEEIRKGAMQKGTKAIVSESPSSVPKLHIKTISKPVNSTLYIVSEMYISPPDILAGEVTN